MVAVQYRACKKCQFLTEGESCPKCGGETSREWQGYVYILDYTVSAIAKSMGIESNGTYALKVR
ncbi:MAG: DNA-directed RNA polymerase subunit E [Candidatus Thermoplasmatota archaeon]|nr:DNA-directed RNA polymerase subunit E [Candidatus Thermoplasmatota archaeon]